MSKSWKQKQKSDSGTEYEIAIGLGWSSPNNRAYGSLVDSEIQNDNIRE